MSLFDLCPDTGLAITPPMAVRPEMIDYNGHVNVAFYVKLFDEGLDILFERIGLSRTYVETRQMSFFALEAHVRYLREISLTDRVRMRLRLLDLDRSASTTGWSWSMRTRAGCRRRWNRSPSMSTWPRGARRPSGRHHARLTHGTRRMRKGRARRASARSSASAGRREAERARNQRANGSV